MLWTCVSAQSLEKPKDMTYDDVANLDRRYNVSGNCSAVEREEVFNNQVKYLWFNEHSITEYSRLLEEILTKYPEEKFDQINLRWKSGDRVHPFRVLDSSGSDSQWIPLDKEDREDLERSVLELGNGFSAGKAFQFTVDRTHSEFVSRLAIKMLGTDVQVASSLYSGAVRYYRCYGSGFDNIFLDRTDVSVENDELVFVTRLPRGSVYKLLPKEPQ
jgi:hypothetical protein